jgi:prevent-host-death family protein
MAIRKERHSTSWSVSDAKAHLDDVLDEVENERPQTLVRNGDERAAIVPVEEWGATTQRTRGTLAEFFHNSPLRGSGIVLERHPDTQIRDIDL